MASEQYRLILADPDGHEIRELNECDCDFDAGGLNSFVLTMNRLEFPSDLIHNSRVFVEGAGGWRGRTEFGGLIRRLATDSGEGTISFGGMTWRGMLDKKIIEPPAGADYFTASGDLNDIISRVIAGKFSGDLFFTDGDPSGVELNNYQFDRYTTVLKGLTKMLKSVGYRLGIEYVRNNRGNAGFVKLSAQPIRDLSKQIQFSESYDVDYQIEQIRDGVNHLICRGSGELREQEIVHLYVQKDGTISQTPYYTGTDEITDVYDSFGAERADLIEGGTQRLEELRSKTSFGLDIENLTENLEIGDIVGGRDYITGLYVAQPIAGKIFRRIDGEAKVSYTLED